MGFNHLHGGTAVLGEFKDIHALKESEHDKGVAKVLGRAAFSPFVLM